MPSSTPVAEFLPKTRTLLGSDGDWTHLFQFEAGAPADPALVALFATFQADLKAFSERCDAEDAAAPSRTFPDCYELPQLNPKFLETSVSV